MKKTEVDFISSRACELFRESEYAVAVSDFMTPGEKVKVYNDLAIRIRNGISRCFFWGGCRGAERCAAVFLPEWYMPESMPPHKMILDEERCNAFAEHLAAHPEIMEEIPITAIRITGSGFSSLTHRDFMGGLLSLGIERSVIGDIAVVSESEAIVFVLDKIAPYIAAELKKIGRDRVKTEIFTPSPEYVIPRKYESMSIVVSSPRVDGIVKAITGKSREVSADMVRAGLVELSYESVEDVSTQVRSGDILTVRGYGKYVIGDIVGETKSGRLRLTCKKYV